ncbi:hypothetical protein [Vallitalea sp.]|jgi:hypothetical protein|uniref:hypothetical protein n=1 Tax=Vallitalea sp. TaxID=1882829 RepID=UPI0025DE823B|nr:hypothetical protein [Vallitalea sp.]MCT4686841.1 hypothetical protein [Vallitalea sp.]
MKYCPNCKEEYEDEVKVCKECNIELFDCIEDNNKSKIYTKFRMAKKSLKVMAVLFAIGIILILFSGSIGESMGEKAIQSCGGCMDTSSYERIIDTNTSNFRIVGLVLSLVGGFGTLLSGYAVYKELN